MYGALARDKDGKVALLAEGVDRNQFVEDDDQRDALSPSSRRAWIEIVLPAWPLSAPGSRPPRGGRG